MPFTIGGEWVPAPENQEPKPVKPNKPVKVRLAKRGQSVVTTILNLPMDNKALAELLSLIKKKLGSGGTIKDGTIEVQGDKCDAVKKILTEMKIKST